jgi:hypothetical protein
MWFARWRPIFHLIRKYEPNIFRIFLQDGSNDLNIYAGDWWKANETMERSLVFAGYEVNHAWGEGAHNGSHRKCNFPAGHAMALERLADTVAKGNSKMII